MPQSGFPPFHCVLPAYAYVADGLFCACHICRRPANCSSGNSERQRCEERSETPMILLLKARETGREEERKRNGDLDHSCRLELVIRPLVRNVRSNPYFRVQTNCQPPEGYRLRLFTGTDGHLLRRSLQYQYRSASSRIVQGEVNCSFPSFEPEFPWPK